MDPLTTLALVGTARRAELPEALPSPVAAVLSGLADVPIERRILLAVGARAVATMAGKRAEQSVALGPVAPAETCPPCSENATRILRDLVRGHHAELLPEAFERLAAAKQRLPYELLPDALRVRGDELRAATRPVLGERGAWLARMNDAWSWAVATPVATSFDDLEGAWTDGAAAVRRELIVRARGLDPARARGWLEATWPHEKADERVALLAGLETGITIDDEPFLEAQLRDRAAGVREAAQALLAHLPASAFVGRMKARADLMLKLERSRFAFLGKPGSLSVNPSEAMDAAGERDGLGKPPQGVGAKAFWLTRVLSSVPLAHWTSRFDEAPAGLVAAAAGTDWAAAVCTGWTQSALLSREPAWLDALWGFLERADDKTVASPVAASLQLSLLQHMTPADAATRVERLFDVAAPKLSLPMALSALQRPWPKSVGMRWLDELRRAPRSRPPFAALLSTVPFARLALPRECFERALAPIESPESLPPFWERALDELTEVVRLRQALVQEIAP